MSANSEYTEITKELITAKASLEKLQEQINELYDRFTEVEFDSESETGDIEAVITKLEETLELLDDKTTQSAINNKIAILNDDIIRIEETESLREELAEMFEAIEGMEFDQG